MTRRALTALLSSVFVVVSLLVATPASATIRVSHGVPYVGVTDGSAPVMAVSGNGHRVVMVSAPRAAHGCADGTSAFAIKGAFADDEGTNWEDHTEWLEAIPGDPCSLAREIQVVLSDDGTSGLIFWTIFNVADQSNEIRFARIDWSEGSFPTVTQNNLRFSAGPWNMNPLKSLALSLDGSRAVIAWANNVQSFSNNTVTSTSTVEYSVVDMENPSAATEQAMPGGTYSGFTYAPDVAISADGSIVMMSRPGTVNQTSTSEFRIARLFTCSHNCYPSRLKKFEATVAAGSGGYNLAARMNLAGDRIAVAWAKSGLGRKPVVGVFNPNALVPSATPINITSKIKPVAATSGDESDLVFAMNETGTKIAYLGRGIDKVQVVTASITPALAVSSVATSDMYPAPVQGIRRLDFLNATVASPGVLATPERLLAMAPDANAVGLDVYKLLVSDSSTKPTNWSEIFSTTVPATSYFSVTGYAASRSSTRFVVSADKTIINNSGWTYSSLAQVGNIKNVLSVTTKPALTGTGVYNKAITLGLGKWTTGASVTYVWKRDGAALDPQPAGLKYTPLSDDDMGARMSATITATKPGFYDTEITPASSPVMNGKPIRLVLTWGGGSGPNGAPFVGDMVWVSREGTFPGTGQTVWSYSWKIGNRVVGTAGSYIVAPSDVGKKISLTMKVSVANWAAVTQTTISQTVLPAPAPVL